MGSGAGCMRQQRAGDQLGTGRSLAQVQQRGSWPLACLAGAAHARGAWFGLPREGAPPELVGSCGSCMAVPDEPGPPLSSPCGSPSCPQMLGPPVRAPKLFTSWSRDWACECYFMRQRNLKTEADPGSLGGPSVIQGPNIWGGAELGRWADTHSHCPPGRWREGPRAKKPEKMRQWVLPQNLQGSLACHTWF